MLEVPKSDLQITRGTRSRDKTVAIGGRAIQKGEECIGRLVKRLTDRVGEES